MKYEVSLKVCGDAEKLYECFEPELGGKGRARFSLKKGKGYVLFEIKAEDSVALRATLNSITKLLTVYEKIKEVK